jgi:SAM-dependent methyltransferase
MNDEGTARNPLGIRAGADPWSERAEAYRESEAHREGPDLDLIVAWAAGVRTALDVATGGGHVARRLREAGLEVVSCDPAPGMRPDVICHAEDLPFADGAFDVVACRVAAHHFADPAAAVREMARVSAGRVLIVDNLYLDEGAEEADKLRDPSHVRNYTEAEWRAFCEGAGLRIDEIQVLDKPIAFEPFLERAGCTGEDAERVRELLADRIRDGWVTLDRIALRTSKGG